MVIWIVGAGFVSALFLVIMNVSEAIPPLRDYLHNRDRHVAIAPRDDR
jgi:hypothetical protein